jgi:hypothetical protein
LSGGPANGWQRPSEVDAAVREPVDRIVRVVPGLSPLLLFVYLLIVAPQFLAPMFETPPAVLGVPLGWLILAIDAALATAAIVVLWSRRFVPAGCLVLPLLTVPSTLLVTMGPAICIIAREMAIPG